MPQIAYDYETISRSTYDCFGKAKELGKKGYRLRFITDKVLVMERQYDPEGDLRTDDEIARDIENQTRVCNEHYAAQDQIDHRFDD